MSPEIAARLEKARISLAAQTKEYWLFARDNCMALVHSDEKGFTSIGSSGVLSDAGLGYLVWREGRAFLAAHGGNESPATPDQVAAIGKFSEDLREALQVRTTASNS